MRGTVAVEVSMNGGADFTGSGVEYMYEQGIRISGLRPSEGRADKGGQTVTVIGEGFPRAGGLSCWFGMHQRTRAYYVSDTAVLMNWFPKQPKPSQKMSESAKGRFALSELLVPVTPLSWLSDYTTSDPAAANFVIRGSITLAAAQFL